MLLHINLILSQHLTSFRKMDDLAARKAALAQKLGNALEKSEKKNSELKEKVASKKNELKIKEQEITNLKAKIETQNLIATELENTKKLLNEKTEIVQKVQSTVAEKDSKIKELEGQLSSSQSSLSEAIESLEEKQLKLEEKTTKLAKLLTENEKLKEEKKEMSQQIGQMEINVGKMKGEVKKYKADFNQSEESNKSLTSTIDEFRSTTPVLQNELEDTKNQLKLAVIEKDAGNSQLITSRKEIEALTDRLAVIDADVKSKNAQLVERKVENQKLMKINEDLTSERRKLEEDYRSGKFVEGIKETYEGEKWKNKADISRLHQEIASYQEKIKQLEATNIDLLKIKEAHGSELKFQKQNESLEKQLLKKDKAFEVLQRKLEKSQQDHATLKQKITCKGNSVNEISSTVASTSASGDQETDEAFAETEQSSEEDKDEDIKPNTRIFNIFTKFSLPNARFSVGRPRPRSSSRRRVTFKKLSRTVDILPALFGQAPVISFSFPKFHPVILKRKSENANAQTPARKKFKADQSAAFGQAVSASPGPASGMALSQPTMSPVFITKSPNLPSISKSSKKENKPATPDSLVKSPVKPINRISGVGTAAPPPAPPAPLVPGQNYTLPNPTKVRQAHTAPAAPAVAPRPAPPPPPPLLSLQSAVESLVERLQAFQCPHSSLRSSLLGTRWMWGR